MTTVKEDWKTSDKSDDNTAVDYCISFEAVYIKQETDEFDIGSTRLQPPDICYDLLPVKAEVSSNGASTSKTNPALLGACEDTYEQVSVKMITVHHPCTTELKRSEWGRFRTDLNLFECSLCGQNFRHFCRLKRHMMIHTGEKPYACSVCEYKTANPGHLKLHMTRHTDEKSFECSLCSVGFKYNSSLKRHMRIHTDEKSDYKAAIFGHLNMPLRCHTGGNLSKCSTCRGIFNY